MMFNTRNLTSSPTTLNYKMHKMLSVLRVKYQNMTLICQTNVRDLLFHMICSSNAVFLLYCAKLAASFLVYRSLLWAQINDVKKGRGLFSSLRI